MKAVPVLAAAVVVPLALSGCARGGSSAGAPAAGSRTAAAPVRTTAVPGSPSRAVSCNADHCTPPDWDTARTSTPLPQIPPFAGPVNVVIGARSTVSRHATSGEGGGPFSPAVFVLTVTPWRSPPNGGYQVTIPTPAGA